MGGILENVEEVLGWVHGLVEIVVVVCNCSILPVVMVVVLDKLDMFDRSGSTARQTTGECSCRQ